MATLNINGTRVKVDDSFLQLSRDEQQRTVEEIASQMGASPAKRSAPALPTAAPNLTSMPVVGPILGAMGFDGRVEPPPVDAQARYDAALQKVRESQYGNMSDEQWREYSSRALAPYSPTELSQHGALFGLTDEMGAAIGAVGSQARQAFTGEGPGYGEAYTVLEELERARRDLGREKAGWVGTAAELAGGIASAGKAPTLKGAPMPGSVQGPTTAAYPVLPVTAPSSATRQAVTGAAKAGAQGAAYGFGATDGDVTDRLVGAATTGLPAAVVGAAVPTIANAAVRSGANRAARSATTKAINAAPTSNAIKAEYRATKKAAEGTGAVVDPPAMVPLRSSMAKIAADEGLVTPAGTLATGLPKVESALRAVDDFSTGPLSVAQAVALRRSIRRAASSQDGTEAAIGRKMLAAYDDHFENLTPAAFRAGDGKQAVELWTKARKTWARAKRTESIERIIANARLHRKGFAAGLRREFESVLRSARRARDYTDAELQLIREFVEGDGNVPALLKSLRDGSPLIAGLATHAVTGNPLLAGAAAVAKPLVGVFAGKRIDNAARRLADELRADIATLGGLPKVPAAASARAPGIGQRANQLVTRGAAPVLEDRISRGSSSTRRQGIGR